MENDVRIYPVTWDWGVIEPMKEKFIKENEDIYGKLDKSILHCTLSENKRGATDFYFLLLVFGNSENLVILTRDKKIIIPFSSIEDYQYRIINGENSIDINLNSLSCPLIKIPFGTSDDDARDLDAILKIVKKKKYEDKASVEIKETEEVEDFFMKISPNGGFNGPGCMIFLILISAISSLIAII